MQSLKMNFRSTLALTFMLALATSATADDAINWRKDLEEAKQEAAQTGRLVLLHFYGSACPPCAKLDKEVFCLKKTGDALEVNYVPVKVNVDHSMAIASAYNVTRWPTDVIITPTGQTVAKFISPQGVDGYLTRMDQVAVATKNQAAAGLVNMGPNGTNPYSNIATADSNAALAANNNPNNYAAPTQYQEAVSGPAAGQNAQVVAPQGNAPYGATNPYAQQQNPYAQQQNPYAQQQNPYANQNQYVNQPPAANTPAPGADRYGSAAMGGAGDRYAQPPTAGADSYGANPAIDDRYANSPEAQYNIPANNNPVNNGLNGAAAGYAAGQYGQPATQPNTQPQMNPYGAANTPPAGPALTGSPETNFGPPAQSTANANPNPYGDRYGANPAYDVPAQTNPAIQANTAPQYDANNPYTAAPPAANPQPTNTNNPYNPAIDYSQAPSMSGNNNVQTGPVIGPANPQVNPQSNAPASGQPGAQAPASNPAFAMDGFCPVSLVEGQRWVQGDKVWGAVHLGQTYLFVSQANQQKFLADPDKFAPVLAGHDPVLALEQNVHQPGSRSHGVFYREHIYLFSNEQTLAQFGKDPERYANGVRQAMMQMQGQRR